MSSLWSGAFVGMLVSVGMVAIRPQQIVYAPGTTIPLTNAFRTNSAVAGLEFVY
jgi:hypothetical protein